jgi:tripartite-type tricarboxylate transporter receptor subunit TctC
MRSTAFLLATLLACATAAQSTAQMQFPTAPVRILVPFAAGGPTDVVARILADLLSAHWGGRSVVVENRPGAGTIVATAAVAKAPPDGHTVLIGTNSLLINPAIDLKLPYDTFKELAGVSMIATQPVALVANKSFPANSIPRACRGREEARRPAQLCLAGPARRRPPCRRDAENPRRDKHDARQLQRQRAGADRRDRRPRADHV